MTNPQNQNKTVFLETFGCQMNVLDSELVANALRGLGYQFTEQRDAADVVLYNTCSVRQQAEDKVYGRLGDAKRLKQQRPDVVVGVIGCMAERDGEDMRTRYPQVDLMCGPADLDKVPLLLDNVLKTREPAIALQGRGGTRRSSTLAAAGDDLEMLDLSRSMAPQQHNGSAYVRITRGCNKFCTYCVVPYTRGAEVHRPPDHIVEECKRLAEAGVIEITLLGQTVNHYLYDHGSAISMAGVQQPQVGPGGKAFKQREKYAAGRKLTTFAELLKRIHDEVPAIQRLRFVTSYPRDFGDDILHAMADCERICNYLHAPAQHGSDRVLKLMNREYTIGEYDDFVERARSIMPDVQIASDFIVGFPTESEDEFEATKEVIRRCRFKNSFIFKYSPRPGTIAIDRFEDDIPDEVKRRRNVELLEVQAEVSQQVHGALVGQTLEVFVEGVSKKGMKRRLREQGNVAAGWDEPQPVTQLSGRTRGDLIVMFDGSEDLVSRLVNVRVETAKPLTLFGELADEPAAV